MGISYNKAILVGRLTKDPDTQYTKNGMQITKFTIAVDRQKGKDGQQETDFLRIVCFGKQAEFAANWFKKGSLIMVEGRIQVSKYQAQDGSARYSTDIIAENIRFMETKKNAGQSYDQNEVVEEVIDSPDDGDEVPF